MKSLKSSENIFVNLSNQIISALLFVALLYSLAGCVPAPVAEQATDYPAPLGPTTVARTPLSTEDYPAPVETPTEAIWISPTPTIFITPTPTVYVAPTFPPPTPEAAAFPETPLAPAGLAATLHHGDIWLVAPGQEPEQITAYGDVFVLFDWNWNASLLLFGRGRVLQPEFSGGDTTQLWVVEVNTRQSQQLTDTNLVSSVAWSPVDDRFAYCDHANVLRVVKFAGPVNPTELLDLTGNTTGTLENVLCGFNWSPDGSAIALPTYTADMIDSDGLKYSVLGVWWLDENRLQVFSTAKDESHFSPMWSTDGQHILFLLNSSGTQTGDNPWWNIVDVVNEEIKALKDTPIGAAEVSRSCCINMVVYRIGADIYTMDFEGHFSFVGQGSEISWLADGKTVLYRVADGNLRLVSPDLAGQQIQLTAGGSHYAYTFYTYPEYLFP